MPGIAVDLRDVTVDQLAGFDAVVHMAALSNDPLGSLAPEITYDVNHHASTRLARLAKEAGVRRFVYASTCSVYGAQSGDELVDEDAPLKPVTPYAISKVRVEDDLIALADADFVPVSMRNATAFGFSPRLRADIVLNNLVGHAVLTGVVKVLSDGTPWRPLAHAEDIAGGVLAALAAPADVVRGRAYNVGSERNNRTVAEIAQAVVDAVPTAKLAITGETGNDPRSYRVDFSRARRSWASRRVGRSRTAPFSSRRSTASAISPASSSSSASPGSPCSPRGRRRASLTRRCGCGAPVVVTSARALVTTHGLSTGPPACWVGLVAE